MNQVLSSRISPLDNLRGLAIFLMIVVNSLAGYANVPLWLKHAPFNGFTLADIIMPVFLFSMGFSYSLSLKKRLTNKGLSKTVFHFIIRYMILYLFGLAGTLLIREPGGWGVLETLGFAGLFSLPFIFLESRLRFIISILLSAVYQAASMIWADTLIKTYIPTGLGGPFAVLSWSFPLIFASSLYDWLKDRPVDYRIARLSAIGVVFLASGILLSIIIPINKHLVSVSYILFSTGTASLLFMIFIITNEILKINIGYLDIMGKNSLLLYMFSSVIILVENIIIKPDTQFIIALSGTAGVLALIFITAWIMNYKKIFIKL